MISIWRRRVFGLLGAATVVWLAGCGAPVKKDEFELVFPPPPDDARFRYERSIFSSRDVSTADTKSMLRRMFTGEEDAGEGMAKPFGVSVHKGRIFVSDTVSRTVHVFDIPESKYFQIGLGEGAGALRKPFALDNDDAGNLYVVDGTDRRVAVYDRDGNYLRAIGGSKDFDRPSGVAVSKDGTKVFVVDTGGVSSQNHRIRAYNAQTGEYLHEIGNGRGAEPGQLNLPRDIVVGKDGNLYVVDGGNFRVQVFQPDGTFVRTFGKVGRNFGQFARPKGIAADPEGNVYIVDTAFGNFQIFSPEGQLLLFIGDRADFNSPARYMLPAGIEVDEDGRVYVVEQFFRRIDVFRPAKMAETDGYLVVKPADGKSAPASK